MRIRRRTVVLVTLAVVVTVAAGGWVALTSFGVRTVTVEGTSRLSVAAVVRAAAIHRGDSLFRLDPAAVAHRVSALPVVAHVDVRRHWPHGVVISVTERTPVGVVRQPVGVVLLDATGAPFATQAVAPPGLVDVQLNAPVPGAGEPAARAAMQVLGALPTTMRQRIAEVQAPSALAVTLLLRGGRTVVWGSPAHSARKVVVLRTVWHRHATVYDVSTPQVVVTR
jgi:cell division protein FtsQ